MKPKDIENWHTAQLKAVSHLPSGLRDDAIKKIEINVQKMLDKANEEFDEKTKKVKGEK